MRKPRTIGRRLPVLFAGSLVLFVGVMLSNAGNYVLNLLMARLLSPSDYGDLITLFTLGTILAVPMLAVANIVTRDVSRLKGRGNFKAIRALLAGTTKKLAVASFLVTATAAALVPLLANLFHLNTVATLVYVLTLAFTFLTALNYGVLQGLQQFRALSVILSAQALLKIGLGVSLVWLGYRLAGVVWGVVLAQAALYFMLLVSLRRHIGYSDRAGTAGWRLVTRENILVVTGMLMLYFLFSVDTLFAKHFFTPEVAGGYAALTVLGKLVLFATISVAAVLLPLISERAAQGKPLKRLLVYAIALVYLPGFALVSLYAFAPVPVVGLFFPAYPQIQPYLGLYGGLSLILSIVNLLVHYFIAIRDYRFIGLLAGSNVAAVLLLLAFHQSFFRIITATVVTALAAAIGSLVLVVRRPGLQPAFSKAL